MHRSKRYRLALLIGLSMPLGSTMLSAQQLTDFPLTDPTSVLTTVEEAAETLSEVPATVEYAPAATVAADGPVEVVQERYPNGAIKIRREMTLDAAGNYILHGQWTMFDVQGNVLAAGSYENNQRHGAWTRQHSSRDAELFSSQPYRDFQAPFTSQATFKNGQLHGTWTILDSQKRKVSEWEFVDGKRSGVSTWFFASGKKMKETHYTEGLLDGQAVSWDLSGKVVANDVYQQGRKLALKTAKSPNGGKTSEGYYLFAKEIVEAADDWWNAQPAKYTKIGNDDRHGRWTSWYPNGQKEYEGAYEKDLRSGQFTWWYENSQVRVIGSYKDGKPTGDWSWWHENGQKSASGQYREGEPSGAWAYWNPDGRLRQKSDFAEGQGALALEAETAEPTEAPAPRTSRRDDRQLRSVWDGLDL